MMARAPDAEGAQLIVSGGGQAIVGVVSSTVTVVAQLTMHWLVSKTVTVTWLVPTGNVAIRSMRLLVIDSPADTKFVWTGVPPRVQTTISISPLVSLTLTDRVASDPEAWP